MKPIGADFQPLNIQYRVGVSGVMGRDSEDIEHLALIRESKSRRVTVVRVSEKYGQGKDLTLRWLDRVLPQDYIPAYENPENDQIDLYLDEFEDVVQA